jgi:hypothetical protein
MALFRAKQVKKFIAGKLFLGAIPVSFAGANPPLLNGISIQSRIVTALTAAAADGTDLPNRDDTYIAPSTAVKRQEGFPSTSPSNLVEIYNAYYQKLYDAGGNEVYGRLQRVGGSYSAPYEIGYTYASGEVEVVNVDALANTLTVPAYVAALAALLATVEANFPPPHDEETGAIVHYVEQVIEAVDTYVALGSPTMNGAVQVARDFATAYAFFSPLPTHMRVQFFTKVAGVETAYAVNATTFGAAIGLNVVVPYTYSFDNLPMDFASGIKGTFVSDDPASAANGVVEQILTYIDVNDFSPLTHGVKTGTRVYVSVNGIVYNSNQVTIFAITPITNKLDWKSTAPYALEDEDVVVVKYVSNGVPTI